MKPTHSRLAALRLSPLSSLHPAGESRPLRVYLDRGLLAATCLVLLAACASARAGTPELSSSATDEQLRPLGAPEAVEETLRWYRDAKLGMLVFWGPFAIYGANSEWVMYTRKIPPAEYRERTMKDLNPVKWDPDAVARMAKDAGCKFIMFTAKFHDGFCWWKTATTDFNIVDGTQYKRDVCRELADACRKHGIRLGFYWSSGKDWMFQYSGGWNSKPRSLEDLAATINIPQVKELFGGYEPLYLWYDGGANPAAGIEETIRINRQMKPDAPISPRSGGGDYQGSGDYNIMDPDVQLAEQFWEGYRNDHTVGSWGYTPKRDEVPANAMSSFRPVCSSGATPKWKEVPATYRDRVIRQLCESVSCGGTVLFNIGPKADGEIAPRDRAIFEALSDWMKTNSEAIHGTRRTPFVFQQFALVPVSGGRPEESSIQTVEREWYCTRKGESLYFHLPSDMRGKAIRLFGQVPLRNVRFLGAPEIALPVEIDAEGTTLRVPETLPDRSVSVAKAELSGPLLPDPLLIPGKTGGISWQYSPPPVPAAKEQGPLVVVLYSENVSIRMKTDPRVPGNARPVLPLLLRREERRKERLHVMVSLASVKALSTMDPKTFRTADEPSASLRLLKEAVEKVLAEYPADSKRVILIGETLAGSVAWEFAQRWPELLAGLVVVSATGDRTKLERMKGVPVLIVQDERRKEVEYDVAGMTEAFRSAGGNVTGPMKCQRGSFLDMPEVRSWIYRQKKP